MNVKLWYKGDSEYEQKQIWVLWSQNPNILEMEKTANGWFAELELPPGEYRYRFLVNGGLELTDPGNSLLVPDEEKRPWSLIRIDEAGARKSRLEAYSICLDGYSLKNEISSGILFRDKKTFCIGEDRKVAARFAFQDVKGNHSVTVAWYGPEGSLFQYAENMICENDNEAASALWFWMDLEEAGEQEIEEGIWKLCLFVDGKKALEDFFFIYRE